MTPEQLDAIRARAEINKHLGKTASQDEARDTLALLAYARDLEARIKEAQARAYDKGYTLGRKDGSDWRIRLGGTQGLDRRNPYRAALTATEGQS